MGIYNRDYFRDEQRTAREQWLTPAVKWLIIANVVVFILQMLTRNATVTGSVVGEVLALFPGDVLHGEIWRLLTYAFCHSSDGVMHILFNMLFLGFLGQTLERMYGSREFALFYLVGALLSGVTFAALALMLHDPSPALGASGAIMAVVMLYALHFPREEVYIFFLFRVQIRFLVLFYVIFDLWPVLNALTGGGNSDGVAHSAHLGGLAFGYAYHRYGLRFDRLTAGFKRFRKPRFGKRRQSVHIYEPPRETPASLDMQVDAILEKIQAHGEASLTDAERDLLRRASERYKGQRQG